MQLTEAPIAATGMLIRRPPAAVFEAFVDPQITSKFWFTHGSGRLEAGTEVRWEWRMYGFSTTARTMDVVDLKKLVVEWGEPATTIEWTFSAMPDDATFVEVRNHGFQGTGDECVKQAIDSTDGFAQVLAGAKAWLEHGLQLGLIRDRHPKGPGPAG